MVRTLVVVLATLTALAAHAMPADPAGPDLTDTRLLRMPDIHGDAVVFVYGGDLWTVPSTGGEARRLTSSIGYESSPKFSPDGRWIAFSGEYDGNNDVYVMPSTGGEPVRLTFHPAWDRVIDWQPDGESIRFQSPRQSHTGRDLQLFTVPRTGGLPERMILPTAGLSSYAPDGNAPRLHAHLHRDPHLEAVQGRLGAGHLDLRPRREHLAEGHRLGRQRRLPDVARRHHLLHERPRGRQAQRLGLRHPRRHPPPDHPARRVRRQVPQPRRQRDRLRERRLAVGARPRDRSSRGS